MHASSTRDAATLRPAGSPAGRPNLSRATRRDVRRAAALANELNFFSFTVHPDGAITWILRHQGISMAKPKPEGKGEPAASEEPSARTRRSRARAAAHAAQMQLAREFRARNIIALWRQAATPLKPAQLPPSQAPSSRIGSR